MPVLGAYVLGVMSADLVFDYAGPAATLTFYRTMLPSVTAKVCVPVVTVCMAVCVVHMNCFAAAQWPDRVNALCFIAGAPYFFAVVEPAEQALIGMQSAKDVGFSEALATIRTGHLFLVLLVVSMYCLLQLRMDSERAKKQA
jgi:hypothetical protein